MYEVRKQVKMKVSLSRKIHIIALPQGTGNAFLSPDQSATTPGNPGSGGTSGTTNGTPVVVNGMPKLIFPGAMGGAGSVPANAFAAARIAFASS